MKKVRQYIKEQIDLLQYYYTIIQVIQIGKAYLIKIYLYEPMKVIFRGETDGTMLKFTATNKTYKKMIDIYLNRFKTITKYNNAREY